MFTWALLFFHFYIPFSEVENCSIFIEGDTMAFGNISNIIHYIRGDWARENYLMDKYLRQANKKLQILVDNYDDGTDIGAAITEYDEDIYTLGLLHGARFGRSEVLRMISEHEKANEQKQENQ